MSDGSSVPVEVEIETEEQKPGAEVLTENVNKDVEEQKSGSEVLTETVNKEIDFSTKNVKDLSKEERERLINDSNNGINNDYFKVVKDKNGKISIRKRPTTKSQQLINENKIMDSTTKSMATKLTSQSSATKSTSRSSEQKTVKSNDKVLNNKYLTNEQLLFEHIIDLETRFAKMKQKHKKLKNRYNTLENDVYADDVEVNQTELRENQGFVEKQDEVVNSSVSLMQSNNHLPRKRQNWRNAIQYLN